MHAAGRALERISIAIAAVSVARGATNRKLACGMEELRTDAAEEGAPVSRRGRLVIRHASPASTVAARSNSSPHSVQAPRRIVLVFVDRRQRDVLRADWIVNDVVADQYRLIESLAAYCPAGSDIVAFFDRREQFQGALGREVGADLADDVAELLGKL
ncbi:MAG: hypothetical protein JOZ77_07950 [Candidatus Eremiobacteraeota bacterium]|nr:hypothetical protein [Candidatus Eremiobacteraeota bacterium]